MKFILPIIAGLVFSGGSALAEDLPIFDAHIHYSHDAVALVPPEEVAKILREAGVRKALVSSSDDRGTQLLLAAAPEIIVPALRPYRRRGAISTWMHDPSVIDYLTEKLARYEYEAIGEFHAFGDDIQTDVIQSMIAMARERDLLLHHHGDRAALDQILVTWPEARVLWAHSGFAPPHEVADALRTHPRVWADLAFRSDMAVRGKVNDDWRAVFEEFPDRFMVGTDTFAPERWYYVGRHADFSRDWLADLPTEIARNIAFENAEAMLGTSGALACSMPSGASLMIADDQQAPSVYAHMDTPQISAPFPVEIAICDPESEAKLLKFDAIMPAHQHGMNFSVDIAEIEANRFEVSNVVFHMPGLWEMQLDVEIAGQRHAYKAEVTVE